MLDNLINFFKKMNRKEEETELLPSSSDAAKERLHLVLMQDRVNVSVDFMDMMKGEIIDVIKKYIDIDEKEMDVRLTNQINEDGTNGTPALYANIPIVAIKNDKNRIINSAQTVENKTETTPEIVTKSEEIKKETVKKRAAKTTTTSTTRKVNKDENGVENKVKTATKTTSKTRKTVDK